MTDDLDKPAEVILTQPSPQLTIEHSNSGHLAVSQEPDLFSAYQLHPTQAIVPPEEIASYELHNNLTQQTTPLPVVAPIEALPVSTAGAGLIAGPINHNNVHLRLLEGGVAVQAYALVGISCLLLIGIFGYLVFAYSK